MHTLQIVLESCVESLMLCFVTFSDTKRPLWICHWNFGILRLSWRDIFFSGHHAVSWAINDALHMKSLWSFNHQIQFKIPLDLTESRCQPGHSKYRASGAPVWCHATVRHLTSGLATVVAMCQHSNEHMLKVGCEGRRWQ